MHRLCELGKRRRWPPMDIVAGSDYRRDMPASDFCVSRDDLRQFSWQDLPTRTLTDGEVLLRVDRYGFTANNITYALLGDAMRYWDFFPAPAGLGRIPVWGFADVISSRVADLPEGERLFGYLPMSSQLVLRPERISAATLVDASEHRRGLAGAYQQYFRRRRGDPDEDLQALLRPLFGTGFLIDDWLNDEALFGARRVLLGSASSKTALSTAFCLSRRSGRAFEIVGLTSAKNRAFCEKLGYYDRVLGYDELAALSDDTPSLFVDMAGDHAITSQVHTRLGAALRYSCIVGLTHQGKLAPPPTDLPGPRPQLFSAPERLAKLGSGEALRDRILEAQTLFFADARRWLQVEHAKGPEAIERVYLATLAGEVAPAHGSMLSP